MAKIVLAVAVLAMIALGASAQTCDASTYFHSTATCTEKTACETALCTCLSAGAVTNSSTCVAEKAFGSATVTCALTQSCSATYLRCLSGVALAQRDSSSTCSSWAMALHVAVLDALSGGNTLQTGCANEVCRIRNATGNTFDSCSAQLGANYTSVCTQENIVYPGSTTAAPTTATPTSGSTTAAPLPGSAKGVSLAVAAVLAAVAALV